MAHAIKLASKGTPKGRGTLAETRVAFSVGNTAGGGFQTRNNTDSLHERYGTILVKFDLIKLLSILVWVRRIADW